MFLYIEIQRSERLGIVVNWPSRREACQYKRVFLTTDKGMHDETFLFLSFRRVLNVICSFLGNSPASES